MNNARRKQLTDACEKLYEALNIIEDVYEEESDAFENMPDSLKSSERGEKSEEAIDALDEIKESILDFTTTIEYMIQ